MASECGGSGKKQPKESACCGGGGAKKTVLLYACSGAANVAEIADHAARELTAAGCGSMFCLAGLGADIQGMVQTARDADLNVLIDGCPMECARKVFDRHGITNYTQVRVTDLGIEKVKGVRATPEQVAQTMEAARAAIAKALMA
ncbi:MAG: putative zinc-binding protein [Planctomycetes bacterium]|nr:putative zinc-binding protein [Planctomycetota bacterium]